MSSSGDLIASLIRGLGMVGSCIDSQVLAGISAEDASSRLFESSVLRTQALPRLKADDETAVVRAISTSSFDAERKTILIKAIHGKSIAHGGVVSVRSKNQTCLHFENMLPDTLWEVLKTQDRTDEATASILSQHGSMIGLVNPSEKTLRRMVSIVGFVQRYQRLDQAKFKKLKENIQFDVHKLAKQLPEGYPYLVMYRGEHIVRGLKIVMSFVCLCVMYVPRVYSMSIMYF